MDKSQILRAFNDHFIELIEDVARLFPDNRDIKTLSSFFSKIRKANPRLILKTVKTHILVNYREQIENGDIHFFIEKDYTKDLSNMSNSKQIISKIDMLRDSVREMNNEDKIKVAKYLKNLLKLSDLYN